MVKTYYPSIIPVISQYYPSYIPVLSHNYPIMIPIKAIKHLISNSFEFRLLHLLWESHDEDPKRTTFREILQGREQWD